MYLVKRGEELCLAVRNALEPMVCNQARAFISGDALLVRARGNLLTVALPDAVKTVRITTPGSKPFTLEAADALAVTFGDGSRRLEWTAPDGTPRTDHIYWGDAATSWGRFWDVERPADHLDDLPGARRIVSDPKVDAWLVPRRGAVCLVVRAGEDQNSGCRRNLGDTRFPIVVSVEHRIVAAFPDRLRPLSVEPPSRHSIQSNALLIRDGDYAVSFTYRDGAGPREVRLPEQKDFVLHADPMSPLDLMPE